jgi:hypothetical protein
MYGCRCNSDAGGAAAEARRVSAHAERVEHVSDERRRGHRGAAPEHDTKGGARFGGAAEMREKAS